LSFKSLIQDKENKKGVEKVYIKLLAFGISDFGESNQIWEKFKESRSSHPSKRKEFDLLVCEFLSQSKIQKEDFNVKQILALSFQDRSEKNIQNQQEVIALLEKIFPSKIEVSSMTPSPIHFGPLEGFLSDSFSDIDLKTLFLSLGFWVIVYYLIIYYLYF
jgi:hypothetical protein